MLAVVLDDPASLLRGADLRAGAVRLLLRAGLLLPAGMGFGDVKLAGIIGGMLGFLSYQALTGRRLRSVPRSVARPEWRCSGRGAARARAPAIRPVHDRRSAAGTVRQRTRSATSTRSYSSRPDQSPESRRHHEASPDRHQQGRTDQPRRPCHRHRHRRQLGTGGNSRAGHPDGRPSVTVHGIGHIELPEGAVVNGVVMDRRRDRRAEAAVAGQQVRVPQRDPRHHQPAGGGARHESAEPAAGAAGQGAAVPGPRDGRRCRWTRRCSTSPRSAKPIRTTDMVAGLLIATPRQPVLAAVAGGREGRPDRWPGWTCPPSPRCGRSPTSSSRSRRWSTSAPT